MTVRTDSHHPPRQVTMKSMKNKTKRKKRKELLAVQLCFAGGMLLIVTALSHMAKSSGSSGAGSSAFTPSANEERAQGGRKLLQLSDDRNASEDEGSLKNCTAPAIHEFPTDIFTNSERAEGFIALHVLCAVYMFCALALVCDDYFVPSLEKICERLELSEDVAGATFMAAGSSAPELFTSVIGVFVTKGDVGVGTIVGSAVFNILCIIGVCGFFAGQAVRLSHWTLIRDSAYYTLSVTALIVFIHDEKVTWVESLILIIMYLVYIIIMKFNSRARRYFESRKGSSGRLSNGMVGSTQVEDGTHDASMVLLRRGNAQCRPCVVMVDELMFAYPRQLSFSEAGMRVMITSHFPPRTRLTMASRMLINERQRLINTQLCTNRDAEISGRSLERRDVENGLGGTERDPSAHSRCRCGRTREEEEGRAGEGAIGTEIENEDNENNENDGEGEEESEGAFVSFTAPSGVCSKLKWLAMWPLCVALYYTVPNCARPRWQSWFMATFITATLWIAALSYVMVWMVTVIGYTLGIPDVIMGITFLAAGTSVPDCMASLIVARQGLGDMAISNSIGSNVFDILVGLGLPWTIQTLAVAYGSTIHLNSRGLVFSVGLLLASVFLTVLGVHLNHWTLDQRLGSACLLMYAIFLCFSILIEYNVFTFVNLPMCREDL